jgi:uncharacterized protein (DUF983 family)
LCFRGFGEQFQQCVPAAALFTVWSSLAHAVVMAVHAVMDLSEWVHLVADIPALVIVAAVLAVLTPRRLASPA